MLERRTIVLADGTVRSYFALPHDYQDFNPPPLPMPPRPLMDPTGRVFPGGPGSPGPGGFNRHQDYWNSLGLDGRGPGPGMEGSMKRKYIHEEEDKQRQLQQQHQFGHFGIGNTSNGFPVGPSEFFAGTSGPFGRSGGGGGGDEYRASKYIRLSGGGSENVALKHLEVDQSALKKAFLHFAKLINETANQRNNYLENGKNGRLQCLACGRSGLNWAWMCFYASHSLFLSLLDLLVLKMNVAIASSFRETILSYRFHSV